tara:strand:+ start:261 stop:1241 length:981 start_codon:yes stop_codon:yes gene_type:complete
MEEQTPKKIITLQDHFDALRNMSDDVGILQHESNTKYGYSIDDQSRALIVLSRFSKQYQNQRLANTYLNFIKTSKRTDGNFNNYKDSNKDWITKWKGEIQTPDNFQDCYGRSVWALSEFIFSDYPESLKTDAKTLLFDSLKIIHKLTYPHSLALTSIGLSKYLQNKKDKELKELNKETIKKLIDVSGKKDWMTYCVGRIPQALFLAGKTKQGEECLDKVIEKCFDENGMFHPNQNPNGAEQPVEAGVITEACIDAYNKTKNENYLKAAKNAFHWFNKQEDGGNFANKSLISDNGAIYDAIKKDGIVSKNCGAESIVTYMMALSYFK